MKKRPFLAALAICSLAALSVSVAHSAEDSTFQVQFRKSGWLGDYSAAKAEAKRTGKPMFVVFRCEPCGECGQFDEQVKRLNEEIADVADKYVRVRLVRITGVDLRLFDFDYDVTWFAFFLNADEHVYGRYGGRDAVDAQSRDCLSRDGVSRRNRRSKPIRTRPLCQHDRKNRFAPRTSPPRGA